MVAIDATDTPFAPWDDRYENVLRPHLLDAEPDRPLRGSDDLVALGLDSVETIQLLLDLEATYCVTFPDELLTLETFSSVGGLWATVSRLVSAQGAENGERGCGGAGHDD